MYTSGSGQLGSIYQKANNAMMNQGGTGYRPGFKRVGNANPMTGAGMYVQNQPMTPRASMGAGSGSPWGSMFARRQAGIDQRKMAQASNNVPPNTGTVSSTITPGIYNANQTQQAINANAADWFTNANPDYLSKMAMRPGVSRDAGTTSLLAGPLGRANAGVMQGMASQPMLDRADNEQFMLAGQTARSNESLQMANILRQLQQNKDYKYTSEVTPLLRAALYG